MNCDSKGSVGEIVNIAVQTVASVTRKTLRTRIQVSRKGIETIASLIDVPD